MIRKFKEEKLRRDVENEKLKECTFKPKTNTYDKIVTKSNSLQRILNAKQE